MKPPVSRSARKVSEIFLEYAAPMLTDAPSKVSRPNMQEMLDVLASIWNAVVIDEWNDNDAFVTEMRQRLAAEPQLGAAVFEPFLERKRELFGEHKWAVGKVEVRAPTTPAEDFIVHVEARGR